MDIITAIKLARTAKTNGHLNPYPQAVILLADLYLASLGKRERTKLEKQLEKENGDM